MQMHEYNLHRFNLGEVEMGQFQFIAHLLDRVLLGKKGDEAYRQLEEAVELGRVWEVHLFNETQEVFAAREGEELIVYQPLFHRPDAPEQTVTRIYELEEKFKEFKYTTLHVREYLDFDEAGLAYVQSTVLYKLAGGEGGGSDE